jgi:uridine kinase
MLEQSQCLGDSGVDKGRVKPHVVVISGSVGSGKTTLAERLAELLGGVPVLTFDHYERYAEWPQDIDRWIREGADPNQVSIPRMKEDLLSLLEGESITHPLDDRIVNPAGTILVEEPSGREREEIAATIDLLVYVDVPQDVCVIQVIERALGLGLGTTASDFERTIGGESREDLERRLKAVAFWLSHYRRMRPAYVGVSGVVKQRADVVVDGTRPVDDIAREVLDAIEDLEKGI